MLRIKKEFKKPSRTQQQFKQMSDVNNIVKKYKRVLGPKYMQVLQANVSRIYDDVSQIPDLRGAIDQLRHAEDVFLKIPAKVREKFDNDPVKFVSFVCDPANQDELVVLGLAEKKKDQKDVASV